MKKTDIIDPKNIKPDLKHDTMEYAAPDEADNWEAIEKNQEQDDEITAKELEMIEAANTDEEASALNSVETDRQADNDVNFDANDPDNNDEADLNDDDYNLLISNNP